MLLLIGNTNLIIFFDFRSVFCEKNNFIPKKIIIYFVLKLKKNRHFSRLLFAEREPPQAAFFVPKK